MAKHKVTPMMEQYSGIKAEHPDAILFFRMGDFYETFFEDAPIVASTLGITLTSRGERDKNGDKIPLAGFPHHALDSYLYKMIEAGHKVAICEQIEDPKTAKGIVKRAIVRLVTRGTFTDAKVLDGKANHFIAAVYLFEKRLGLACADLSTGEFFVTEVSDEKQLTPELARLSPAELLVPEAFERTGLLGEVQSWRPSVTELPPWEFDPETSEATLLRHFQTASLDGFGCAGLRAAVGAAGALIGYLHETQKANVQHVTAMTTYSVESFMALDAATQHDLELIRSARDGSGHGTLLQVLDATLTPMGGRKLRQTLTQPLLDLGEIRARLASVEELRGDLGRLDDLRGLLKGVYDVERLVGRIGLGSAHARDLLALGNSLAVLPVLRDFLAGMSSSLLVTLCEALDPCEDVVALIRGAIHDDPPTSLRDGRLIRDGHHAELDDLRDILVHGKERIADLQARERESTKIPPE